MSQKLTLFLSLILALLLPLAILEAQAPSQARATVATTITVNTTADFASDGFSKTCANSPADECTLRRAINEAHNVDAAQRPVYIEFDIPTTDAGYDAALQVWKIEVAGISSQDLRELYGQTIIDGRTQPGGRADGPKIVVDGLGNHNYGLILRQNGNEVYGLAMQRFSTAHISISSDGNRIEECWFGLSDDGMTLSSGDDLTPEGGSGVSWATGSDTNVVRNNVFAGFFGVPAAVRGNGNVFAGNWIGMRADGTVPVPAQFNKHPCLRGAWTGGSGITVSDNDNQIGGPSAGDGNIFAGLFLDISATSTQRPALDVGGTGHLIQNNIIGRDVHDTLVGVCGRGLDLGNGPSDMDVLDNAIHEPGLSAILMNESSCNGNTLWGNTIVRDSAWPEEQEFNDFPEGAIAYGRYVPDELKTFVPAAVTEIDGTTVRGTSGDGSPCPLCTVELFADDTDAVTETLASLAMVTADANGDWQATLAAPLSPGTGIRTMSTVPDYFTIVGLDPGTTSNLSVLYGGIYRVFLPMVVRHP
jgi:hypothetical protein